MGPRKLYPLVSDVGNPTTLNGLETFTRSSHAAILVLDPENTLWRCRLVVAYSGTVPIERERERQRNREKTGDWTSEWELVEDTPGIAKWRVRARREDEPTFLVSLLGATVSKMAELHRRELTLDDFYAGVRRAIARERGYAEQRRAAGEELPDVIEVMVRDSDLAELDGKVVGPTNNTPC